MNAKLHKLLALTAMSVGLILPSMATAQTAADSLSMTGQAVDNADSVAADSVHIVVKSKAAKRDWATWRPEPKRAMWLAIVLPGAGQIYNRKFWKLPIFYGGFVGCIYALTWNNQMYHDYSQAYLDIMDDDPNTQSYNQFLHLGRKIDSTNESRYKDLFRRRKDKYRRWRDLSLFAMIGVYALSIVDAYVDASLSQFDISSDLSLQVAPAVINTNNSNNPIHSSALGVGVNLTF